MAHIFQNIFRGVNWVKIEDIIGIAGVPNFSTGLEMHKFSLCCFLQYFNDLKLHI